MAEHTTHEALRAELIRRNGPARPDCHCHRFSITARHQSCLLHALLDGAQAQASPQPAADLRALLAKWRVQSERTSNERIALLLKQHADDLEAALASAPQPAEGRTQPTWDELRSALDAAKHAMADVRTELDLPDQAVAWHRLGLEIAQAERLLLRCPVPPAPEGASHE